MADPKPIETPADLTLDPKNANQGTERGMELLRESIDQCGVGRGIVADKHGVVIGGNKTLQIATEKGIPIEVVQTSGEELVVIQRMDLDLVENPEARQLAYYDNRVQELDLNWSGRQMRTDMLEGVDLGSSFFPEEVDKLTYVEPMPPPPSDNLAGVDVSAVDVGPVVEGTGPPPPKPPKPAKSPRPHFALIFENITQQIRWTAFMRALREKYPDAPSQAARLSLYLTEVGIQ